MNVSLPDATAYNSKQLAIQKDMTPSLYAMFFKVTYNRVLGEEAVKYD